MSVSSFIPWALWLPFVMWVSNAFWLGSIEWRQWRWRQHVMSQEQQFQQALQAQKQVIGEVADKVLERITAQDVTIASLREKSDAGEDLTDELAELEANTKQLRSIGESLQEVSVSPATGTPPSETTSPETTAPGEPEDAPVVDAPTSEYGFDTGGDAANQITDSASASGGDEVPTASPNDSIVKRFTSFGQNDPDDAGEPAPTSTSSNT